MKISSLPGMAATLTVLLSVASVSCATFAVRCA